MADKGLDPKSAKAQLLTFLGKMAYEAEKVKAQIAELESNSALAQQVREFAATAFTVVVASVLPR